MTLEVNRVEGRRRVDAELVSRALDIDDLAAVLGARPQVPTACTVATSGQPGKLLPDAPLRTERLRVMDGTLAPSQPVWIGSRRSRADLVTVLTPVRLIQRMVRPRWREHTGAFLQKSWTTGTTVPRPTYQAVLPLFIPAVSSRR